MRQLQARALGGEIDHRPDLTPSAGQRDVQLQAAVQRALALPAGKRLAAPERGVLQDLQAVAEAAAHLAVDLEHRHALAAVELHLRLDVLQATVQHAGRRGAHAHAAVLDEHLALQLAQRRPVRLVGQLGIMHLEVQPQCPRLRRRALVQRALVDEHPLLDLAAPDRRLQPCGQLRTEARRTGRQVAFGVACQALMQTDLQVHVVLGGRVAAQADQHVAGQLALLAGQAHQRAGQGEGVVVETPVQPRPRRAVAPRRGEQGVEMEHEVVGIQAQLAALQTAAEAAADVGQRRYAVPGTDPDLVQAQVVLDLGQSRVTRANFCIQVAQAAMRRQAGKNLRSLRRQGRQGAGQRGQRRQIEALGLHTPIRLLARVLAQLQLAGIEALLSEAAGQLLDQQAPALRLALEVGGQGQIGELGRRLRRVRQGQAGGMQAGHRPLRLAAGPVQPDFATGLQAGQLPVGRQTLRQPGCPVALRQAEIQLRAGLTPRLGLQTSLQLPAQRLAIGQQQAAVEALFSAAIVEGQTKVVEGEHLARAGFEAQPAVLHQHLARRQQQAEQPRRIERWRRRIGGAQALEAPATVGLFVQAELQALQLQAGNAQAARTQAGEHVRDQTQLVQMQRLAVQLQLHVAQQQQRRQALPAPLQRADAQGLAKRGTGPTFQLAAILGHQRHQRAPQADVQRRQQQNRRRQDEQAVQQPGKQATGGRHVRPRPQSSTTSYCSWEYSLSTWKRIGRPMKASRSATLPDSSSSRRPTTLSLASTR
ncbi:hypothetical protein D3C78_577740 [compost metagenome]